MGGYHKKFPAPIVATLVLLDRLIEWKKYQAPSISRYMINDPESNGWSLSSQSYSSLTNILLIVIQSRFNRSDPPVDLVVQHFGKYYLGEGRFVCEVCKDWMGEEQMLDNESTKPLSAIWLPLRCVWCHMTVFFCSVFMCENCACLWLKTNITGIRCMLL